MTEAVALLAEDPRVVGPYRLEGRLGLGGQGTVYMGRDGDGGLAAIKLLHPHLMADPRERQLFLREVETAKRVAPFCTAQVLDLGFVGDRPYIVSEYVDGPSLQNAVRDNGPRGAAALQRLAVNTATALAAIHEAGVVHRDFKPGNVLLGPDGPVVIDFGIARALDLSQSVISSRPIGSPAYMAPEQIAGGDVGPAADVFAWGATMVYAATGERAFAGDSIPGILHGILQGEPDLGGLEGALRELLRECLDKDPARRPTIVQVIERLRALPAPAWHAARGARSGGFAVPDVPGVGSGAPTAPGTAVAGGPAVPARKARRGLVLGTAGAGVLVAAAAAYFALAPSASGNHAGQASQAATVPAVALPSSSVVPVEPSPSAPETPTLDDTPTPKATKRSQAAKAVPRASAAPQEAPRQTRKTTTTSDAPTTTRTMKPTRKPVTAPIGTTPPRDDDPPPPPHSDPPAPAQGSITFNDASAYCAAQGQSMAGGTWDNLWCFGGAGARISATTVCQWKYQGRDAVAEQPPNTWSQEVTCRLS
ncbi:protein kinase domain-containing protein [Nonomuraea sp. NPDC004354]